MYVRSTQKHIKGYLMGRKIQRKEKAVPTVRSRHLFFFHPPCLLASPRERGVPRNIDRYIVCFCFFAGGSQNSTTYTRTSKLPSSFMPSDRFLNPHSVVRGDASYWCLVPLFVPKLCSLFDGVQYMHKDMITALPFLLEVCL